jgi:hypothetical protein
MTNSTGGTSEAGRDQFGLYLMFKHLGYEVDFLCEQDLVDGKLTSDYKMLVCTGSNLLSAALSPLENWISAGGTIYMGPGALAQDEFNQPLGFDTWAGINGTRTAYTQTNAQAFNSLEYCSSTNNLSYWPSVNSVSYGGETLDAKIATQTTNLPTGATSLATFTTGGGTAVYSKSVGTSGKMVFSGLFLGLAYEVPACNYKETQTAATDSPVGGWSAAIRSLFQNNVIPTTATKQVAISGGGSNSYLIEADRLETTAGTSIIAISNWSGVAQNSVTFTIPLKTGQTGTVTSVINAITSQSITTVSGVRQLVVTMNLSGATEYLVIDDPIAIQPADQLSQTLSTNVSSPVYPPVTFSVVSTWQSPTYKWQKLISGTWTDISGATTSSYTVTPTGLSDNNTQYRVIVYSLAHPEGHTSAAATLRVSEALISSLSLDEPTGLIPFDSVGTQTTMSFVSTAANNPTATTDGSHRGLTFGSTTKMLRVDNLAVNTAPGAQNVVDFWMKWDGTMNVIPFSWGTGGSVYALAIGDLDGHTYFGFTTTYGSLLGIVCDATGPVGTFNGQWKHVTAVFYNGVPTTDTVKLYIDGQVQTLTSHPQTGYSAVSRTVSSTAQISGWRYDDVTGYQYPFSGMIDDVKIYALPMSTPIALWKFDETSGSALEAGGHAYETGMLYSFGSTTWTTGQFGGGLLFSTDTNYVDAGGWTGAFKYTGAGMTLGAWVYLDPAEADGGYLISKPWGSASVLNYSLGYDADKCVFFTLTGGSDGSPSTATLTTVANSKKLSAGAWHYVAATVTSDTAATGAKTMTIYIDGVNVAQTTHSITAWTNSDDQPVFIGSKFSSGTTSTMTVKGRMDQVAIYGKALTAFDIKTLSLATPPTIVTQPTNQTVLLGGATGYTKKATFVAEAVGSGLTYQWWYKAVSGSWGTIATGGTGAYYTTATDQAIGNNGDQYYVVVTDAAGNTITSSTVTLTVLQMAGWWKCDENTGTTYADSSGNTVTSALVNSGTNPAWSTGILNSAPTFTNASKQLKLGSGTPPLTINTATGTYNSVSFWMYWDGSTNGTTGVMPFSWNYGNSTSYYDVSLDTFSGTPYIGISTGNDVMIGCQFPTATYQNKWTHVTAVFINNTAPSASNVQLYLNGQNMSLTNVSGTTSSRIAATSAFVSGYYDGTNALYRMVNSRIDDVRIYQGQITAEAAADLARAPAAFWKLDETSGNAADATGYGYTATASNITYGATYGYFNNGASYNGTTSHLAPSLSATTSPALTYKGGEMTVGCWAYVKPTETDASYLISKPWTSTTSGDINYSLYRTAAGAVVFTLRGSAPTSDYVVTTNTTPLQAGTGWHYVAATVVGATSTVTIYVDGVAIAATPSGTFPTAWAHTDSNIALSLGSKYSGSTTSSVSLNGCLDNVRVYDRALNAADIRSLSVDPPIVPAVKPRASLTAPAADAVFTGAGNIMLTADAGDVDGVIREVDFYADGKLLGSDTTAPYSWTWTKPAAGLHQITVKAIDNDLLETLSAVRLIRAWSSVNLGGATGSDSYNPSTGLYTVTAKGKGVGGTSDSARLRAMSLTGDFTLTARVASFNGTLAGAAAGLMMRQSASAGSIEASLLFQPQAGQVVSNERAATGGATTSASSASSGSLCWLRMVRSGSQVTTYQSADGQTWTLVNQLTFPLSDDPLLVGLVVSSGSTAISGTATFDHVAATRP